jgi:hypothetical protein
VAIKKLYNIGCSFSYGNCISEYETFAEHLGPGSLLAEHLGCEEVNIASPGLSLDGVLRRLYTFEFEKDCILFVGLPPELRFQTVAVKPRNQDKTRGGQGLKIESIFKSATAYRANAFNKGPKIPTDWFCTQSWIDISLKNYNADEQLLYHTFFNILLIQKRLKELGYKYWLYNSVYGHMQHETKITEIQQLKDSIDLENYYQPNLGMRDLSDTDTKYQISRDDTHPNHLCYEKWIDDFVNKGI